VAIGNEVLLREDMSEDELLAHIQHVKAALPGVPVGYVDAYYLFEKHPAHHGCLRCDPEQLLPLLGGLPARPGHRLHAQHGGPHPGCGRRQAGDHQRDRLA